MGTRQRDVTGCPRLPDDCRNRRSQAPFVPANPKEVVRQVREVREDGGRRPILSGIVELAWRALYYERRFLVAQSTTFPT